MQEKPPEQTNLLSGEKKKVPSIYSSLLQEFSMCVCKYSTVLWAHKRVKYSPMSLSIFSKIKNKKSWAVMPMTKCFCIVTSLKLFKIFF